MTFRLSQPLCVDSRTLAGPATGVATYAATLLDVLRGAGAAVRTLSGAGRSGAPAAVARGLRALRPGRRTLRATDGGWWATDLFREAQVHFSVFGRMLTVECPEPPGIMHWTYPVPLRLAGWRNLYTVHDVIPLTHPELTPIERGRQRRLLARVVEAADRIIAVTHASAAEIARALGCPPEMVSVCEQGVDVPRTAAGEPLPRGLHRGRYLLFAGTLEPRKNVAGLIAAYRESRLATPLVLAGPMGWRSEEIAALIAATPGVIHLPFQERSMLIELIAGARALLFPSLAEGFGLTIAEAMTLGTPVLTSRGGPTEEVADGAALLVDPHDLAAISEAIRRLSGDAALRGRLQRAGRRRAGFFAREAYAARLQALYAGLDHG